MALLCFQKPLYSDFSSSVKCAIKVSFLSDIFYQTRREGEGEVVFFSAKRWNRRSRPS